MGSFTSALTTLVRLKQLELYEKLRGEGCCEATALDALGWSRATYYRWKMRYREDGLDGLESGSCAPRQRRVCQWTKQQEQQVLHLRQRFPLWGKRKLWRVLVRDQGWVLSESTVGHIVAKLVLLNRSGRTGGLLLWPGQTQASPTVHTPCKTLALRDEGKRTGGVDAG